MFIADDSLIIRDWLVEMLDGVGGVELVGQAATVPEAVQGIRELKPDVVILDLHFPEEEGAAGWMSYKRPRATPRRGRWSSS